MKISLDNQLFKAAMPVMAQIESHGYEAYFVGGCVRDSLLGLPIHDIDITSSAQPQEIEAIFKHTIDVGKEHGTIIVMWDQVPYEVTTFRIEGKYSDHRRPDSVAFVRNLQEDTLRRDFTVNALALDRQGQVYDFHDGLKDLKAERIRAVGNAEARFQEDGLRMMRALRFASQLGFSIEETTLRAIQKLAPTLKYISMERIRIEFSKFLLGSYLHTALPYFLDSNLSEYLLLPQGKVDSAIAELSDLLEETRNQFFANEESFVWMLFLQKLGLDQAKMKKLLRKWTFSNKFIDQVLAFDTLMHFETELFWSSQTAYAYNLNLLEPVQAYRLFRGDKTSKDIVEIKASLPMQDRQDMLVDGKDVMAALELKQGGPLIGQILAIIEAKILHGELSNEQEAIISFVKENWQGGGE